MNCLPLLFLFLIQLTSFAYPYSKGRYNHLNNAHQNIILKHNNSYENHKHRPRRMPVDCPFNICEHVADYPESDIKKIIKKDDALQSFFKGSIIEPAPQISFVLRDREDEPQNSCPTVEIATNPKQMRDTKNINRMILNIDNYTQIIKFEVCLHPREPCYPGDSSSYKTFCVQKYNIITLATVKNHPRTNKPHSIEYRKFQVPSTCVCTYTKIMVIRF